MFQVIYNKFYLFWPFSGSFGIIPSLGQQNPRSHLVWRTAIPLSKQHQFESSLVSRRFLPKIHLDIRRPGFDRKKIRRHLYSGRVPSSPELPHFSTKNKYVCGTLYSGHVHILLDANDDVSCVTFCYLGKMGAVLVYRYTGDFLLFSYPYMELWFSSLMFRSFVYRYTRTQPKNGIFRFSGCHG